MLHMLTIIRLLIWSCRKHARLAKEIFWIYLGTRFNFPWKFPHLMPHSLLSSPEGHMEVGREWSWHAGIVLVLPHDTFLHEGCVAFPQETGKWICHMVLTQWTKWYECTSTSCHRINIRIKNGNKPEKSSEKNRMLLKMEGCKVLFLRLISCTGRWWRVTGKQHTPQKSI